MQELETTQNGCKCDANCFHMIRLEPKTFGNDMNVTVVSTVTGCDVTTVQQHYKGSTSTFERFSQIFVHTEFFRLPGGLGHLADSNNIPWNLSCSRHESSMPASSSRRSLLVGSRCIHCVSKSWEAMYSCLMISLKMSRIIFFSLVSTLFEVLSFDAIGVCDLPFPEETVNRNL